MAAERIDELTDSGKSHPKEAKVLLGKTIINQFYDEASADLAAEQFEKVFAQNQLPDDMAEIKIEASAKMAAKLLVYCKLVSSSSEAKRMIKQSAASIDGERLTDPNAEITPKDGAVVRVGKRKFARVKICD